MINRMTAILMAGMAVSSCEGNILHKNPPDDSKIAYSKAVTDAPATGVSEDEAHDLATETLASMSFDDVADASMCTVDCEGHDAGFQWAKENGYTDASSCSGNSQSFIEGCEAYGAAFERQVQEELKSEADAT